jgi:hypothetical protein
MEKKSVKHPPSATKSGPRVIKLDNSANSAAKNPPGYNIWVGGKVRGDTQNGAVKVNKGAIQSLTISSSVLCKGKLLTWYYDYGWYSGEALSGPFYDGQTITIPTVSSPDSDLEDGAPSEQKKCQT